MLEDERTIFRAAVSGLGGWLRLSALALAGAACLAAAPAQADDKPVQLKLSHWLPPSHPLQASIQEWIDSIKKDSGGTITGIIFPAEQLGKAMDHYDMSRDGIADASYVSPGYQPGRFPVIGASDLPFQVRDAKNGTAAVDAWYRKYADREMKDVHYCFAFIHDPGTLHSRSKIMVPSDVKGLKIRPANATMGSFTTLLGGNNVQASAAGARDLLERGVADAIFFPWGSTVLFGIDKVVKYHIDAPLYASTFVWVLNKARYEAMSPAQKKVIDDHCNTEWAARFAGPWADFEAAGRDKIRAESGHEMISLTPEQLALWRKAAEPLRASWAEGVKRAGVDPDAAYQELQDSIAKYHAAY